MSGSVIERGETTIVDGVIIHDDQPVTWEAADQRAGFRLDRRKAWGFLEGKLCETIRWTQACSGCSCDCGDGYGCNHGAGGCQECGYTGRVRQAMWMPYSRRAALSHGETGQ